MRGQLEQFFKQRLGLAIAILLFAVFTLVFVIPNIFFSLEPGSKKVFWVTFLFTFGLIMFIFFGPKLKTGVPSKEKAAPYSTARSYQQLLDEEERCSQELKKQQRWVFGCLIMGWIILSIGKLSGHPPYNHPIFAIPVFVLAFLAATRSWEKEYELDVSIANCTIDGIELENKRQGLKSSHFHDVANSYEGWGMWQFAFIRVSPSVMIVFSLLNGGPLSLLANHLSIPGWIISCGSGMVLGIVFLLLAKMACQPYSWLLEKKKAMGKKV